MLTVMANNDNANNPFADYLWMGEMDKFDEQLEEELKEQEFIKSCIEQLLEEEEERETIFYQPKSGENGVQNQFNQAISDQSVPYEYTNGMESLNQDMQSMYVSKNNPQMYNKNHQQAVVNNHQNHQQYHVEASSSSLCNTDKERNKVPVKSTLNPNATPFLFNPNAKEFIPRSGGNFIPNGYQTGPPSYSMPSHSMPSHSIASHTIPSHPINGK